MLRQAQLAELAQKEVIGAWRRVVAKRVMELRSPFDKVWKPFRTVRKEFHARPDCRKLKTNQDPRHGRLGSMVAKGWLPCPRCFPDVYAGLEGS